MLKNVKFFVCGHSPPSPAVKAVFDVSYYLAWILSTERNLGRFSFQSQSAIQFCCNVFDPGHQSTFIEHMITLEHEHHWLDPVFLGHGHLARDFHYPHPIIISLSFSLTYIYIGGIRWNYDFLKIHFSADFSLEGHLLSILKFWSVTP